MLPEENFREINGNTKQVNVYNDFWKGMECMDNLVFWILYFVFTSLQKSKIHWCRIVWKLFSQIADFEENDEKPSKKVGIGTHHRSSDAGIIQIKCIQDMFYILDKCHVIQHLIKLQSNSSDFMYISLKLHLAYLTYFLYEYEYRIIISMLKISNLPK